MKSKIITQPDLERWKENTLNLADKLFFQKDVLNFLRGVPVNVIPGDSKPNLYGWAYYDKGSVEVYETNPSKHFPRILWEVWNQSGMDHELIGHLYNFYGGLRFDESQARKTQTEMAKYRGRDSFLWSIAAKAEPLIRKLK